MSEIKTKLIGKHHKDCYAIKNYNEGKWDTPWAYIMDGRTYGTKVAPIHKKGNSPWIYVRCNCTHCDAKLAVLSNSLLIKLNPQRKR